MKHQTVFSLVIGIAGLSIPALACGTALRVSVLAGGGVRVCGAHHATTCTVGQPAIGGVRNGDHVLAAGFIQPVSFLNSGVDPAGRLPAAFALAPIAPNPLRGSAVIRFAVPRPAPVSLQLYDVSGRLAETLMEAEVEAGQHQAVLRAIRLPNGIYFCRMTAPGFREARKVVLAR